MKIKKNISNIAIIAFVGVFASLNSAFAVIPSWFEAKFDDPQSEMVLDPYWEFRSLESPFIGVGESYFYDSKLYLDLERVILQIPSGRSAEEYSMVLTICSTIECEGFDELPPPPSKKEHYKVAVAPMEGDNYYILGYDEFGKTNRWYDSGIATISDRPVEVSICLAYTNCENVAVYEFDGQRSAQVKIWDSWISSCEFVGSGVVSGCIGCDELVTPMIPLKLPQIDGVRSRIDRKKEFGYPDEFLTVYFDVDTKLPSRTSAKFWVAPDGSMIFADDGEYPYGIEIVATRNGVPYATIEEALAGVGNYDVIRLEMDARIVSDVELNNGIIDLNGHYLESAPGYFDKTVTLNGAAVCDYVGYDNIHSAIHSTIKLNVSMDMSWQNISFYYVYFCKPDIVLTIRYPIPCYYSGVSGYEVVMEETNDGCFRYSMVKLPTADVVQSAETVVDERAKLLGCGADAVEEELAKFKIESIRMESGKWVVTVTGGKRHGDRYGNGYVRIYKVDASGNPTDDPNASFFRAAIVPNPPSD